MLIPLEGLGSAVQGSRAAAPDVPFRTDSDLVFGKQKAQKK